MTPTPEEILAVYPRHGFERFALSAIRVALKSTPAPLLMELTRRFRESWRGCELSECPYAYQWYSQKHYLTPSFFGPRRSYKPHDKPLYAAVDAARNKGTPDAKLEEQTLRNL